MSNVGEIGEVVSSAVQVVQEGVQYVDMGEAERQGVVEQYIGFVATVENAIAQANGIIQQLGTSSRYAQVGGEKISEAAIALAAVHSDNDHVDNALRHYGTAASRAMGMVSSARVQADVLAEITGHLSNAQTLLETLGLVVQDSGVDGVHLSVEQGTTEAGSYLEQIGVAPPTA